PIDDAVACDPAELGGRWRDEPRREKHVRVAPRLRADHLDLDARTLSASPGSTGGSFLGGGGTGSTPRQGENERAEEGERSAHRENPPRRRPGERRLIERAARRWRPPGPRQDTARAESLQAVRSARAKRDERERPDSMRSPGEPRSFSLCLPRSWAFAPSP